MKIGVCAGPEQLPLLESLGFDYFEANFSWLAGLDEETYREKTALVEASSLRAEAPQQPQQRIQGLLFAQLTVCTGESDHGCGKRKVT